MGRAYLIWVEILEQEATKGKVFQLHTCVLLYHSPVKCTLKHILSWIIPIHFCVNFSNSFWKSKVHHHQRKEGGEKVLESKFEVDALPLPMTLRRVVYHNNFINCINFFLLWSVIPYAHKIFHFHVSCHHNITTSLLVKMAINKTVVM